MHRHALKLSLRLQVLRSQRACHRFKNPKSSRSLYLHLSSSPRELLAMADTEDAGSCSTVQSATLNYAALHHAFASAFPTLLSTLPDNPIAFASLAFGKLFSDREASWQYAHDLSREERATGGDVKNTSLGYGEVLPETIFKVMACINVRDAKRRRARIVACTWPYVSIY